MNTEVPSYNSMPLSPVQKGAIGQLTFVATALATGKGQVEVYTPAMDNEGRDAEIRRHLKPAPAIGIQLKTDFSKRPKGRKANYLSLRFALPQSRVQNDERLWYALAAYSFRLLGFEDPLYLVPARVFHKLARRQKWKGRIRFVVTANMGPGSRDQWSPYRVAPRDLGKRLLEIIDDAPLTKTAGASKLPSNSLFIGRAGRPARSVRLKSAA
jgi:hypothetical protein